MKKNILLGVLILFLGAGCSKNETINKKIKLENWLFTKDTNSAGKPINWEKVKIPHTANIEPLVVNNQFQGVFWYKTDIKIRKQYADKKLFIHFEGVMQETKVFLNDSIIAHHKGGYLPFVIDITNYKNKKEKISLLLQVNNFDNPEIPPGKPLKELDFNFYGGMYRNSYLLIKEKVHITNPIYANKIASGGVSWKFFDISKAQTKFVLNTHIENAKNKIAHVQIKAVFTSPKQEKIKFASEITKLSPNSDGKIAIGGVIEKPMLWTLQTPNLYELKLELYENNKLIEVFKGKAGVRKIRLKKDGFYLNDKKIFVKGTNRHQEYPYVGYAISDNANYRDAIKIKNAGFDLVRLAHYPHSKSFLDACDKIGLLVMNCVPGWQFFGNESFVKNALADVRNMVRRDRNHPSVIFWEVSLNESDMSEEYIKEANKILREELPYKDTYSAGWVDNPLFDLFIPARQHSKPPSYWSEYKVNERNIFIAEYGDWEYYAQNAGFNQKDFKNLKEEERNSRQLRGYGEKRLLQQAFNFQEATNSNKKGKNTIGHANWVMFDYNRGYSNDIEASGISDIFRIPKFSYYFFKSQQPQNKPFVFIASYWNKKSSSDIRIFSNCDEVELYLNETLIERKKTVRDKFSDFLDFPPFEFYVEKFVPGRLKAVGYIKGKRVAVHNISTPGQPYKMELEIDLSGIPLSKTGKDIVFVYAKIVDKNGTLAVDYDEEITFEIYGKGAKIIGQNPAKAEAGIATILLETHPSKEKTEIISKKDNLLSDTLTINK